MFVPPGSQQSSLQLYLYVIVLAIDPLILSSGHRRSAAGKELK